MSWIADLEPELLRRWLAGDDRAGRDLAEGFWDRQIPRKYAGILKLPPYRGRIRPRKLAFSTMKSSPRPSDSWPAIPTLSQTEDAA
jgi:hypothetical protein